MRTTKAARDRGIVFSFLGERSGIASVEYALLMGTVASVIIVSAINMQRSVGNSLESSMSAFETPQATTVVASSSGGSGDGGATPNASDGGSFGGVGSAGWTDLGAGNEVAQGGPALPESGASAGPVGAGATGGNTGTADDGAAGSSGEQGGIGSSSSVGQTQTASSGGSGGGAGYGAGAGTGGGSGGGYSGATPAGPPSGNGSETGSGSPTQSASASGANTSDGEASNSAGNGNDSCPASQAAANHSINGKAKGHEIAKEASQNGKALGLYKDNGNIGGGASDQDC
jgi:Flp pilus assembly pilin Flp